MMMSNEDSSMSADRIAELKEIFSVFDKKAENKVPNEKVKDILQGLGYDLTESEIQSLVIEHTERNGFTKFEEICVILIQYVAEFDCMNNTRMAFNLMDKDRKGYVTPNDVLKFFAIIGENMNKEQAELLVRETSLFGYDRFNVIEFFIKSMKEDEMLNDEQIEEIFGSEKME
jgi:Ca2+-binding EF-hand superfamily protein